MSIMAKICGGRASRPCDRHTGLNDSSTSRSGRNWQSHTYASVVISTPSSWHVYRNTACAPDEHSGALELGAAKRLGSCVDQVGPPGTVVRVSDLSPEALHTLPPPVASAILHLHRMTIISSARPRSSCKSRQWCPIQQHGRTVTDIGVGVTSAVMR